MALAKVRGNIHAKSNQKLAAALTAGQVPANLMAQTQKAMRPKPRLPIPAAAVPLLPAPDTRKPIDITVYGGAL
jgi:hypothetical protein